MFNSTFTTMAPLRRTLRDDSIDLKTSAPLGFWSHQIPIEWLISKQRIARHVYIIDRCPGYLFSSDEYQVSPSSSVRRGLFNLLGRNVTHKEWSTHIVLFSDFYSNLPVIDVPSIDGHSIDPVPGPHVPHHHHHTTNKP